MLFNDSKTLRMAAGILWSSMHKMKCTQKKETKKSYVNIINKFYKGKNVPFSIAQKSMLHSSNIATSKGNIFQYTLLRGCLLLTRQRKFALIIKPKRKFDTQYVNYFRYRRLSLRWVKSLQCSGFQLRLTETIITMFSFISVSSTHAVIFTLLVIG